MMKKIMIAGTFFFATALFAQVALSGVVTVSDYFAGKPANGVGNSRHNLGIFGRVITTNETSEICVFCHTPHHSATPGTLLWNRDNAGVTYTAYGTTTSGTVINSIGSTSLICLSCHDGVSTFDNLVNAPGAGGVVFGGATDRNWAFKMPPRDFTYTTDYDHFDTSDGGGMGDGGMGGDGDGEMGGLCGNMMCHPNPAIRLSMGLSLSDDHPVSMPYDPAVLTTLRPTNTVLSAINLTTGLNPATAPSVYDSNLSQNRWAVYGFISDTATIADLLRDGKVECGSCHDPHFRNLSWDEAESSWADGPDGMMGGMGGGVGWEWCDPDNTGDGENCTDGNFLRRVGGNTGSAICRSCHSE